MQRRFSWLKVFLRQNYLLLLLIFVLFCKGVIFNFVISVPFSWSSLLRILTIGYLFIFVLIIPLAIIRKNRFNVFVFIDFIFTVLLFSDILFNSYFDTILSMSLTGMSGQVNDVIPAIQELFNPLYLLFFLDILVAIFLGFKYREKIRVLDKTYFTPINNYVYTGIVFLISLLFLSSLFYIDRNKFFSAAFSSAFDNKITVEKYGIYAAHVLDAYLSLEKGNRKLSTIEREEIVTWINKNKLIQTDNDYTGIAKGKNVILIQVESLQSFVVDATINGQEITPNINNFIKQSHSFENNYFQIGAGSTSDSDFTINTSLYSEKYASVFIRSGDSDFTSIAKAVKNSGYSANAYHGFFRSFWNRDVAFNSLGFDKFYGAESYPEGDIVGPGLNDKDFLLKTAEYIESQPKPSFSYIITLSSHYPFEVNKDKQLLDISKGQCSELSCNYLQSVKYADEALGHFFSSLKEKGLYDDSLIILYGDHYANIDNFQLDNKYVDVESLDGKKVPLVIKLPNQNEGVTEDKISAHIDVMPTILNLIGVKTDFPMFGIDLFSDNESKFYSVRYVEIGDILTDNLQVTSLGNDKFKCQVLKDGIFVETDADVCKQEIEAKEKVQNYTSLLTYWNLFEYL